MPLSTSAPALFAAALLCAATARAQTVATPPQNGISVATALQRVGVDANLNDSNRLYGNLASIRAALNYLGVSEVRAGLPSNALTNFQSYQEAAFEESLAATGTRFTLVFADYLQGIAFERAQLDRLFNGVGGEYLGPPMARGGVRIVEGLNEINNQSRPPTSPPRPLGSASSCA